MSESAMLDITEDLTSEQLAEVAMATEVVVTWNDGERHIHGIIVGYEDSRGIRPGRFVIDEVRDQATWPETGAQYKLERHRFVVFGPANRDPGDKPVSIDEAMTAAQLRAVVGDKQVLVSFDGGTKYGIVGEDFDGDTFPIRLLMQAGGPLTDEWENMDRHHFVVLGEWPGVGRDIQVQSGIEPGATLRGFDTLGQVPPDLRLEPFILALRDLLLVGMGDYCSNEPTFRVRLDVDARAARSGEESGPAYPRQFRLLVRPVMEPIMHDELVAILKIAETYELAAIHGQHGVEIRFPDDVA